MATFSTAGKGARAGLAMKSNRGFIKPLSKTADIGVTHRLFIPTYSFTDDEGNVVHDFLIGFGAGRKLDFDVFGSTFMTYKRDWFEDENNIPKCRIGCDQFSKISRVILEAQCNSEKEAAKKAADELALANGGQRDEIALIRKLDKIDEKYHGREAEDGAQRTYATVSPMVSRLDYVMVAEMLIVPMDSTTNTPKWDAAKPTYKALTNNMLEKLFTILDTPGFFDPERGYLEVSFKYGNAGQEKQQAGQSATYNGVAKDMSLESSFPDLWRKYGAAKVKEIAGGERDIDKANDLILKRTGYTPGAMAGEDCKSKLLKWVAKNTVILTHIDVTDDTTKRAAKDMITLGILDGISTVKAKVAEIAAAQGDDDDDADVTPAPVSEEIENPEVPVMPQYAEPIASTNPVMNEAIAAVNGAANTMASQAQDMINAGAAMGARVGQNLQLSEVPDDDDMGDLL